VTETLPMSLIGMNEKLMTQYLEFVTDQLLVQLKCEKEFNATNPFDFIDTNNLQSKTNIFEKRASKFQKAGEKSKNKESDQISFDADL